MYCSTPGFPLLHCLPDFAQTHVHWVDNAIHPSHPLSPPSPPALNLAQHQSLFQWVGSSHQMGKVLEFQHQSFQWIFRVDFFSDWLVYSPCCPRDSQGDGILKHQNSKASILWCSAFFMVQFSWLLHVMTSPYMTTAKIIALTIQTFVSKVMSLLFNMLSRFVIASLPRSKHLLISWLPSPSAVILEPHKTKYCFHCFPIYLPWSDGTRCHDLSFLNVEL